MSFFAVLFALLIEQARPLARGNWIHAAFRSWARWTSRNLDAGKPQHGWIVWTVAVLVPSIVTLVAHVALWAVNPLLAFLWSVGVLYITLGFRQFSHFFTDIRDALDDGDEDAARELLAQWRQVNASELPRSEIVRHVIEYSVLAAHRHVFGVLVWFSVLAALGLGPAGAVLYRLSEFVTRYWRHKAKSLQAGEGASPALQAAASTAWGVIDYVPARITALGFAVVGSFEEAIDAWRNDPQRPAGGQELTVEHHNNAIILAATSGAVNVRLGGAVLQTRFDSPTPADFSAASAGNRANHSSSGSSSNSAGVTSGILDTATQATPGRAPQVAHLRSIVGLVWRSVVLWMVLLALLTLAKLIG